MAGQLVGTPRIPVSAGGARATLRDDRLRRTDARCGVNGTLQHGIP